MDFILAFDLAIAIDIGIDLAVSAHQICPLGEAIDQPSRDMGLVVPEVDEIDVGDISLAVKYSCFLEIQDIAGVCCEAAPQGFAGIHLISVHVLESYF